MAFILPDNILDTLVCSFCHKYLSVKPVKVYPNKLIQCGRCVDVDNEEAPVNKSEGVESLYGKLAETILFKCVNRFDGCRELLTYSQVRDHEQVCLEKIHKCPICYEEMASFLILPHFRSKHKDSTLDCPAFVFNLNDYLEMPSVYIYQEEDNLFFLYISYRKSENTIKLYLVYQGSYKLAKNIYHEFTVSSENKEFDIVLNEKPCTDDFFVVDISDMPNLIQIKFKLIDRNLKVLKAPEISKALRKPIVENASHEHQIQNYHAESYPAKCNRCHEYCLIESLPGVEILSYYWDKKNGGFMCIYCYQWFYYRRYCTKYNDHEKIVDKWMIHRMNDLFPCRCSNNCGSYINLSHLPSHELECKLGRQFICPTQNCYWEGTANKMIEHLKDLHKCMAFGYHFQLPRNISSCYVFVKEYIVFLHVTPKSDFAKLESNDISVELVTKTDNAYKNPTILFFDKKNEILKGNFEFAFYGEVFVKVMVYRDADL
ncbi:uncharacterized protein LOC126891685 [Diabrotica virgifera virgifera]|uniref:SIAH-type domain-containing protein n=1 Tax=Diabrotica virgifera virgifera TaxID=50390 RepID=A0ABM5L389_DIAVI|nr:uncharacterized protein LOC126891685 [Diabrotica virgifera virgifera]